MNQGCVRTLDFFFFFSAHKQKGQLVDREKIVADFEKKYIGFESLTQLLGPNSFHIPQHVA